MIWFGSSAGVAISNLYPEAKSVGRWLSNGWYVIVGYVVGFFVMLAVLGWHPTDKRHHADEATGHAADSVEATPDAVSEAMPAVPAAH
jgi:hypothetical protein